VVFGIWRDKENPAQYCGKLFNAFDAEVKSAMIQMIPAEARNPYQKRQWCVRLRRIQSRLCRPVCGCGRDNLAGIYV